MNYVPNESSGLSPSFITILSQMQCFMQNMISSSVINVSHLNLELFHEKLCSFAFDLQDFHGGKKILNSLFGFHYNFLFVTECIAKNLLRILPHKTKVPLKPIFLLYLFTWNKLCYTECIRVLQKNMYFSFPSYCTNGMSLSSFFKWAYRAPLIVVRYRNLLIAH